MTREEQINKAIENLLDEAEVDILDRPLLRMWYKLGVNFADKNPIDRTDWWQVRIQAAIATIEVDTVIRYWEDTDVDGTPDIDFYESKGVGKPRIPCAVQVKEEPDKCIYSDHWRWRPIIDAETGKILNWTKGVEAIVHYKVCDGFKCLFKDKNGEAITNIDGYVPAFMCPNEPGDGDYIIMDVSQEGQTQYWDTSLVRRFFKILTSY